MFYSHESLLLPIPNLILIVIRANIALTQSSLLVKGELPPFGRSRKTQLKDALKH